MSVEGFTCLLVFKNIFSFALTFKGFEWIQRGKVQPVFTAVASVQVGICMLTVPMCESPPFCYSSSHSVIASCGTALIT